MFIDKFNNLPAKVAYCISDFSARNCNTLWAPGLNNVWSVRVMSSIRQLNPSVSATTLPKIFSAGLDESTPPLVGAS